MGSGPDTTEAAPERQRTSPFQGLGFYAEEDARWFFGRATERKIILAHLRTARLTLLYAESGVGKSSLLRAGVAARLHELAVRGLAEGRSPRFVPVVFSAWKDDPLDGLISEIERQVHLFKPGANGSRARDNGGPAGLTDTITRAANELEATLVIILDQFEEHFTYRLSGGNGDPLADELARCVSHPDVPANFLIAVREDAYGGLGDLFSGRISNVYNNYLHLDYLTRDAAREAIEKPVEIYNTEHREEAPVTLDRELTDAVLDEVRRGNLELGSWRRDRDGGGSLPDLSADEIETPFLQLVMTRLWEYERAHGSSVLRRETLDAKLGGAETIVRNHVSRALAGLDGEQLEAATDIFHELVTPSGVKVAHTGDDLAQMTRHSPNTVTSVLGRLYEERILRAVDAAPGSAQPRYEIFHDRLAAPILDWRSQQESARLERAKQHAEQEAQVQRAQARRFKRTARLMFGLAVGLLVLLVAVVALLVYAHNQSDSARKARDAAVNETAQATYFGLTTRAQSQLSSRPDISLLLYLAAYGESPQPVAERSLVATFQDVQSTRAIGILHGHSEAVNSIAFSPSESILASASGDKTIRLWRMTRAARYPLAHPLRADAPLYSIAFDRTGRILAAGGFDEVILWNVLRRSEQAVVGYDGGALTSVAFSRDGMIAAAGSDGTVLLWNSITHRRAILTVSPALPVRSVAFSPSGTELAVSSAGTVALFNVDTDRPIGQSFTHAGGNVYSVAFSPDGVTMAVGGGGPTIDLWSVVTRRHRALRTLGIVNSIAFSPDGRSLAAGAGQTTVWNLESHRLGRVLIGNQGGVPSVAFSSDGHVLATAGTDGTIKLWDFPMGPRFGQPLASYRRGATRVAISPDGRTIAAGGPAGPIYIMNRTGTLRQVLPGHGAGVTDVVFNPAGTVLAASYADGTIRFWSADTGAELGSPIQPNSGAVYAIAFDPTGMHLAAGNRDGSVRVWGVQSHRQVGSTLKGDSGAVFAVAFSPDGSELASAGEGRAIRLWDASTYRPMTPPLIAQDDTIYTLAFSQQGHLLASGGNDDAIRLWNVATHHYRPAGTLTGNLSYVRSVAFSPDGHTLASGGADDTIRLWDVGARTELGNPLVGHTNSVESVVFSHDGRSVVSGSYDDTVRMWQAVRLPATFSELRTQVCDFLGAGLSRAEWASYAPNIPYRRTCARTTPS